MRCFTTCAFLRVTVVAPPSATSRVASCIFAEKVQCVDMQLATRGEGSSYTLPSPSCKVAVCRVQLIESSCIELHELQQKTTSCFTALRPPTCSISHSHLLSPERTKPPSKRSLPF